MQYAVRCPRSCARGFEEPGPACDTQTARKTRLQVQWKVHDDRGQVSDPRPRALALRVRGLRSVRRQDHDRAAAPLPRVGIAECRRPPLRPCSSVSGTRARSGSSEQSGSKSRAGAVGPIWPRALRGLRSILLGDGPLSRGNGCGLSAYPPVPGHVRKLHAWRLRSASAPAPGRTSRS